MTISCYSLLVVSLLFLPGFTLADGKSNNVYHKNPGESVHGHSPTLDKESGSRGDQLTIQHCASHEDTHHHKQQHKQDVHNVPQPSPVMSRLFEEPACLKEGVGDLTAKEDSAGLDARLPQPEGQKDSQDAHGVVGQHNGPLCAEVHAPGHIKNKVAQAYHHGTYLQRSVLSTWISEGPGSIHVAYVSCDADRQDAVHQGDKTTVPFIAPRPVNAAQDKVERHPAAQTQERTDHNQCHLPSIQRLGLCTLCK